MSSQLLIPLRKIINAGSATNDVKTSGYVIGQGDTPEIGGGNLTGAYLESIFYVNFDHTSAAGVVVIETAHDPSYAGTWANLATVTWSAIDKCHYVALTGVFAALRARISTTVTSGTVDVWVQASSR